MNTTGTSWDERDGDKAAELYDVTRPAASTAHPSPVPACPSDPFDICSRCNQHKPGNVEDRYSFGQYAGRLCVACCAIYSDNCGLDGSQGDPTTLAEYEAGGWNAIEGEA